jgi:hypothetical protein
MPSYETNAPYILSQIHHLIVEARRWVMLISPYLNLPVEIRDALQAAASQRTEIAIIYRLDLRSHEENARRDSELAWIRRHAPRSTLLGVHRLHTKCYLSDREVIVSSMNLLDSSRVNRELAIRFEKAVDAEYARLVEETAEMVFLGVPFDRTSYHSRMSFQTRAGRFRPYCATCAERVERKQMFCASCDPSGSGSVPRGADLHKFKRMLNKMSHANLQRLYETTIDSINSDLMEEVPDFSVIESIKGLGRAELIQEIVRWNFYMHFCNRCGRPTFDPGLRGEQPDSFYCRACSLDRRTLGNRLRDGVY